MIFEGINEGAWMGYFEGNGDKKGRQGEKLGRKRMYDEKIRLIVS